MAIPDKTLLIMRYDLTERKLHSMGDPLPITGFAVGPMLSRGTRAGGDIHNPCSLSTGTQIQWHPERGDLLCLLLETEIVVYNVETGDFISRVSLGLRISKRADLAWGFGGRFIIASLQGKLHIYRFTEHEVLEPHDIIMQELKGSIRSLIPVPLRYGNQSARHWRLEHTTETLSYLILS